MSCVCPCTHVYPWSSFVPSHPNAPQVGPHSHDRYGAPVILSMFTSFLSYSPGSSAHPSSLNSIVPRRWTGCQYPVIQFGVVCIPCTQSSSWLPSRCLSIGLYVPIILLYSFPDFVFLLVSTIIQMAVGIKVGKSEFVHTCCLCSSGLSFWCIGMSLWFSSDSVGGFMQPVEYGR